MAEPIGLELGKTRLRGTGPRDGDEKTPDFGEFWRVRLNKRAEPAAEKIAVVGHATALGGDEPRAERTERRICKRTQNNEPAGFRLTGLFHPSEVRPVFHGGFPRESHGGDAEGTLSRVNAETQELC